MAEKLNMYKIGTRGSLLAVTQCTLIKNEIAQKTKNEFELIKIKTEGDLKTEKPLWQLNGKDFFTKELDHALLNDKVDFVVHSYKDLGSDRPDGIELGAITQRQFPNDILLIKKETLNKIQEIDEFIVGTSSPRRITNIESSLAPYIPNLKSNITTKMLRGNVNTRIEKLKSGEYHAIVLAHAGLERLALKKESHEILSELLEGITYLILPQKSFPSAAAQGALGIEYKKGNKTIKEILSSVHSKTCALEIEKEREAFRSYGGGCHLAVGIHVKKVQDYFIHIHKGEHNNQKIYKLEIEGMDYSHLKGLKPYYMIGEKDFLINKNVISSSNSKRSNLFVTSSYCFHNISDNFSSIWASGNRTHKKLVEKGYFVNGNAEGFGHEELKKLAKSKALHIMNKEDSWSVLSHDKSDSSLGEIIVCYSHSLNEEYNKENESELLNSDIIYWSSAIQFQHYTKKYPQLLEKKHCCGLGKTYTALRKENINVTPFVDMGQAKLILK